MKLKDAIEEFKIYTEITKSAGTVDYYKYYLNAVKQGLGHLECETISNTDILGYIKNRKIDNPKVSNATLNKHVKTLKSVVKYSTEREIKFSKLKERIKTTPTVSKATYTKIFNHYEKKLDDKHNFRNYIFFKLLLDTGLRLTEAVNLKVSDIEFEDNLIHVRVTKTDVDRYVGITNKTKIILYKYIITQPTIKYLFTDFVNDRPLSTSSVESFIHRLKKRLQLKENITPHKWRHTFATNYLRSGGNLETLRILLGHSNLKTTQRYLHLSRTDIMTEYKQIMG
ncbi:MAG: tyrosine-type recombinase/integrase [Bacteroidales bacterium]|jgi:site-specific recombinase XerD|nr:tyrosine-type recombinase/integrase [Bacteroidales bacterium]